MCRKVAAWMAACGLLAATAPAQSPDPQRIQELEEIVVVGRVPGPPLWKVSKGDHALWIMPLVDMYPRKMEWDSARVEKLIAASQEYIARPRTTNGFSVSNPLALAGAIGLYTRVTQLPRGKTLADVLPPDLYQRYRALKSRYFPRKSSIETRTVGTAMGAVQKEILEHENLEMLWYNRFDSPEPIMDKLLKWLKANKSIRRVAPDAGKMVHLAYGEFRKVGKVMEESVASPEFKAWAVDCFEKVVGYFERDLEPVKRRANAWATGRLDALLDRTPLYVGTRACAAPPLFLADGPAARKLRKENPALAADLSPDIAATMKLARERWLAAAEKALEQNTTTFSVLAVDDILDQDGLVEQLRAKGYQVEISAE